MLAIAEPVPPTESSAELVQLARDGDPSALDQLLSRYRPRLQRWASGRLPRYARAFADTEDLVQDALIGTLRNLPAFEDRGGWALQAYLRRAVTNRVRDELRRHSAVPPRDEMDDNVSSAGPSPLEVTLGRQTTERYGRAMARLTAAERTAVAARVELGCSYAEVAARTGKPSPDAARMLVTRALQKLARAMAPGVA